TVICDAVARDFAEARFALRTVAELPRAFPCAFILVRDAFVPWTMFRRTFSAFDTALTIFWKSSVSPGTVDTIRTFLVRQRSMNALLLRDTRSRRATRMTA